MVSSPDNKIAALSLATPFETMKFTLTFEGDLPSSGNSPKPDAVWKIRRHIHPQIEQLFIQHPLLAEVLPNKRLYDSINVKGSSFVPVVRSQLCMICHLDIVFLRHGQAGSLVLPGGDIDNRIKTLFDGLRMPGKGDDVPEHEVSHDPMYTLLENDSLVTGVSVRTDRLLAPTSSPHQHEVKLVIEAKVSVTRVTWNSIAFLGD